MSVSGYSSTIYITHDVVNINNTNPYTIWCWMNDTLANATQKYLVAISSTNSSGAGLEVISGKARFATMTTTGRVTSANTYTANTWNGVGGVSRTTTDRSVYLNGTKTRSNTSAVAPVYSSMCVGGRRGASGNSTLTATGIFIAEVGVWDIDLTDSEMASLQAGFSPLHVRPQNLRHYIPLVTNTGVIDYCYIPPVVTGAITASSNPGIYK